MLPNLRRLSIHHVHGIRCIVDDQVPVGSLSKLQTMIVYGSEALRHIAASDSIKLLQNLKRLVVSNVELLEVIFDFTGLKVEGVNGESLLDELQSLKLQNLRSLKHICSMLPEGINVFKNLKSLRIWGLKSLRYLFSTSMAKMLVGLEMLDLDDCEQMEAIIWRDQRPISEIESEGGSVNGKDGEESTNKIVFSKLRSISIDDLKDFQMFCSENIDLELPSLATLSIYRCPRFDLYHYFSKKAFTLVSLEKLEIIRLDGISAILDDQMPMGSLSRLRYIFVSNCRGLLHVAASNSIQLLQALKKVTVRDSSSLKAVFDFEGFNVEGEHMEIVLDRLESLELDSLPNLEHIWRMLPQGICAFNNLKLLNVYDCDSLSYLLSPSVTKMLVGLESLVISHCRGMEALIGRDERLISEIESEEDTVKKNDGQKSAYKIQFPKLRCLELKWLDTFQMLCSEDVDLELPSLTELVITNCPFMTKFCVGMLSAPRLQSLQVIFDGDDDDAEQNVLLSDFSSWLKKCDSKIRCLACSFYGYERCSHLD